MERRNILKRIYFDGHLLNYVLRRWHETGRIFEGDRRWKFFKVCSFIYGLFIIVRVIAKELHWSVYIENDISGMYLNASFGRRFSYSLAMAVACFNVFLILADYAIRRIDPKLKIFEFFYQITMLELMEVDMGDTKKVIQVTGPIITQLPNISV